MVAAGNADPRVHAAMIATHKSELSVGAKMCLNEDASILEQHEKPRSAHQSARG
jgi:hypothetical protein